MHKKRKRKLVGIGATRMVYRLGKRSVVKIAKSKRGILGNRREAAFYRVSPRRLQRHLGKVRKYGRRWIVMKKYWRPFPKSGTYRRRLRGLKRLFLKTGILPYEIYSSRTGKPNYQNLRIDRKGNIIVIDYGNFIFHQI